MKVFVFFLVSVAVCREMLNPFSTGGSKEKVCLKQRARPMIDVVWPDLILLTVLLSIFIMISLKLILDWSKFKGHVYFTNYTPFSALLKVM